MAHHDQQLISSLSIFIHRLLRLSSYNFFVVLLLFWFILLHVFIRSCFLKEAQPVALLILGGSNQYLSIYGSPFYSVLFLYFYLVGVPFAATWDQCFLGAVTMAASSP